MEYGMKSRAFSGISCFSFVQHAKVNQWTNGVVESCLASLTKLQKPFKYIVTCVIMQKNGAGLHTASSCYWDNSTDGGNNPYNPLTQGLILQGAVP